VRIFGVRACGINTSGYHLSRIRAIGPSNDPNASGVDSRTSPPISTNRFSLKEGFAAKRGKTSSRRARKNNKRQNWLIGLLRSRAAQAEADNKSGKNQATSFVLVKVTNNELEITKKPLHSKTNSPKKKKRTRQSPEHIYWSEGTKNKLAVSDGLTKSDFEYKT